MPYIDLRPETPPEKHGRGRSKDWLDALRVVSEHPGEWYRVKVYSSAAGASSSANRARRTDWNEALETDGTWSFEGRRLPDEGVSVVYAKYEKAPRRKKTT